MLALVAKLLVGTVMVLVAVGGMLLTGLVLLVGALLSTRGGTGGHRPKRAPPAPAPPRRVIPAASRPRPAGPGPSAGASGHRATATSFSFPAAAAPASSFHDHREPKVSFPRDPLDLTSTFGDNTGRWTYEDSLGALVPIDLVNSADGLLQGLGYGPSDFIWEKARGSKTFVRRGPGVLAGIHGDPAKVSLTALEWFLDEREPDQEIVIFSAWGFSAKARSMADRLEVALFRYTAIDRVEPFNKVALQRVRRTPPARRRIEPPPPPS